MMKAQNAIAALTLSAVLATVAIFGFVTMTDSAHAVREAAAPSDLSLSAIDTALVQGDVNQALSAWQRAYATVVDAGRWEQLIEVGDAYVRIERAAGLSRSESKARELYLKALSAAKRDGSANGVLRAAAALDALGDSDAALLAKQVAAPLNRL